MSKELETLYKKINDKIINEMEANIHQDETVIRFIIDKALNELAVKKDDGDCYTFDICEIKNFTHNILKQAEMFVSTMEYDQIFKNKKMGRIENNE